MTPLPRPGPTAVSHRLGGLRPAQLCYLGCHHRRVEFAAKPLCTAASDWIP